MWTVLHVPYTYYPDPVGGTEIYVEQLAQHLQTLGIQNLIVAPGKQDAHYQHRGVLVERIGVDEAVRDITQLYDEGDENAARKFGRILEQHKPDIVHLHASTRIVSARLAQQARERNIPVVFTYHTPTVSCLRGTLMLWGNQACDGELDAERCTACRLQSLGLPKSAAMLFARAPKPFQRLSENKQGGVWTALRMSELVKQQHAAFHALLTQTNIVVALTEWSRRVLLTNGIAAEKVTVVPHGLYAPAVSISQKHDASRHDTLRVVALGRLEPIKGLDLLVRALAQIPDAPITLDLYGITQGEHETVYARKLRRAIERDARIRLLPPVPNAQVIPLLQQYDILAVPSQWFETGPLVVLEAFAAGIPVFGSNLGGIAEKVRDGIDGLLLPWSDAAAWRAALENIARDRAALERLRANVRPPRTLHQTASEMIAVYTRVLETVSVRV